jgi:hypothetical protein
MSPFFTIYGGILLILQYLIGFKVGFNQLHFAYDRRTMEQIGIQVRDFQPAFIPLLLKVRCADPNESTFTDLSVFFSQSFYMTFFWLTLRQYINEKRLAGIQTNEGSSSTETMLYWNERKNIDEYFLVVEIELSKRERERVTCLFACVRVRACSLGLIRLGELFFWFHSSSN